MKKRGQITVFIIIGIVILVGALLYFYFARAPVEELEGKAEAKMLPEFVIVKNFVQKCVDKTAKEAVLHNSLFGGYYDVDTSKAMYYYYMFIPYYIYNGEINVPTKEMLEEQLGYYIDERLWECLLGFENFIKLGYDIRTEPPKTTVKIGNNSIFFEVKYPIKMVKGKKEQSISDFLTTVDNVRLLEILQASKEYAELQVQDPHFVLFGDLMDIMFNHRLFFLYSEAPEGLVYSFIDNSSVIDDKPITFNFAVPFAKPLDIKEGGGVFIEDIPDQTVKAGEEFYLKVNANGTNLIYSDTSHLFDITDQGVIRFTPTKQDAGEYSVQINAVDNQDNFAYTRFKIIITRENTPPVIQEETVSAQLNQPFEYQVSADDPDGDEIIFTLLQSSGGFEMDQYGFINGTPATAGSFQLKISAADNFGGSSEGFITIQVS